MKTLIHREPHSTDISKAATAARVLAGELGKWGVVVKWAAETIGTLKAPGLKGFIHITPTSVDVECELSTPLTMIVKSDDIKRMVQERLREALRGCKT